MLHIQRIRRSWVLGGIAAALLLALMPTGCGSDRTTAPAGSGTLSVGIAADSDGSLSGPLSSSGAADRVYASGLRLTFDLIRVFPADTEIGECGWDQPGEEEGGSSECPYVSLLSEPVTVDTFSGISLGPVLDELELPAGTYSHLAVRVTEAVAVFRYGPDRPVQVSRANSRLIIRSPFTVVEGEHIELVLVIDLTRSLRETPDGQLVLHPVVHAESRRSAGNGR